MASGIRFLLLGLVFVLALAPSAAEARRRFGLSYNPGYTRVEQIAALPESEEFRRPEGPVHLGWAYADYSVLGIPFGYGAAEGYVLATDAGYTVLDAKDYPEIARLTGVDLDRPYVLNPLRHLWGWLLVLAIAGLAAFGQRRRLKEIAGERWREPAPAPAPVATPEPHMPPAQPPAHPVRAGFGRKGL